MEITVAHYDKAIEHLQLARQQKIDGTESQGCSVCGGCCHPDQCGHNPMYAVVLCQRMAEESRALHDSLHYIAGFNTLMGEQVGPASVILSE